MDSKKNYIMTTYIADTDHYSKVIAQIQKVKRLLWIATADLKDLYVEKKDKSVVPLLQILNDLVKKGVEVRLIHAKEPGTAFREDFDKYPALWGGMERRLCPRAHELYRQMSAIQPGIQLVAQCYLAYDYPALHPYLNEDRQDLFDAICDFGWNSLY